MASENIIYKHQHVVCNIAKNHSNFYSQLAENSKFEIQKNIFVRVTHLTQLISHFISICNTNIIKKNNVLFQVHPLL